MNWDNYYKRKTQQNKQSITWDDYYKQRKPEVQQYATESLYNPSYKPKKTYNDADFAPFQVQWQYKWDDPYVESDYLEQLRKMRNLPPQSVISQYDFSNKEDVKRFNEGLPSLSMEMQETNKKVQKDIELYQKERQRLFEQALARKQAEADKKWDWFGLAPKKVEYIDPEEYAPAMPESLSAWQGYLNDLADYNEKLELMDPDEKAYRRAIGNLPKPPDKPGFDLEQFVKWEDLQRDLWEEYLDKQAKQEAQPTVAPTVAPTNTPTGNVQKGAQQLFPMWNKQGGPTSPVPTPAPTVMPTPTPTVQPTGTAMPTYTPTRTPATFGEFQRLQEQQRQEAEQQQGQWKGYNRPVGGTVGTQPDIPSRSPFASGSREALYKAGESKGFGDFQKLQNDMEQERQQSGDPFTAKDILPFIRRLSNVAAHTVSGGNASTFINLESWAKRMEQIVDELDTTTDAERYDELVNEYNTLLERYQNEYQAIDTGNEKANKIADTIGSLIGIGAPIPGAGFTKLEPFRPIGSAVSERVGRPISNLLTKAAEKGASDAAVRGLYFAYQTIPAGVGSAVQFSAMQAMTNVIDPNYEDLSTKEKLEAVGNSALWGLILGSGSAAIKEAVRVGTSYAKPFVVNKVNPKIREIANKPWVNKLLQDKNIAEIRVDKNGNLDPNGGKTGIYMVKDNVTGQIKIQVDGTNTLNVAPRAAWLRAMINEAGETAKEGAKETAKETVTIGLIGPGGGTPKAKQTKAPAVSIPVGSKVTLKGLGEVEVLSETATYVKIRRANGKELDVLKTAFSKGLDKATKKEVSTKTNIQDQFKLTERGQKQLDELLDNPYVDIKQISAPKVDLADGEVLLYRRDRNDRVITNDKAQGLYTTPVYDGNAYTAHEDVGDKDIFIKAKIDNMLTVPPMVERTHRHEKIELSAGAGALKMLDEAEFNKLNSMSKDKAMAYVKQKYPNLNIDNYSYDAYELMEVVGAEKARQHGYDAIYANNEMDPSLNEVVLLTNNFEIIDNAPLKTPTSPVEASKQQDIQTQEEETKTQPEAEIEATSRVVDDSQYGRSGKLAFNKLINDRGIDIESPEGQQFVTKFNEYYNAAMSFKARPNFADESDLELATLAYNAGEGDRSEVRDRSKTQATTEPITETDIIDSKIPTPEDTSSSIVQVDPKDIKVDTKRFQFKLDVDPKTGAGKGLDIEKWDEHLAGIMLVWEAENGDRFIVNGHHRLQKAKELGVDRINAMIVRETDGISDVDAKLLGAKINIAEGHGSITDAAKLFRDGGYTLEQLKAEGLPMKSGNAQKGYAIAQLTDNLFDKVVNKVITENQGAIIGEKIPSDGGINDARQEFILKQLMNKDMTNRVLEETLDAIKSVEASSHTQQTLFGEELVWDVADFEIKPKVIAETKRIISSDKNAFSKIVRNAESLKRVGNILQDDVNVEQKNTLDQALELIDSMKYAKGDEIAEVFDKATSHVQAGGSIKDAGEQAAKEIIDLISEGEYLKGLMGKLPKAETVETDTIPGQTSLFGEEPVQAEQTPITEPTKGGETSGETGISQSEDSKDSPKVPRRTEADAKADAGRDLEIEGTGQEVEPAKNNSVEHLYRNMPQGQLDRINKIKSLIEGMGGLKRLKDANIAKKNDTIESFIGRISTQESKWDGNRKLQGTAIQMLSEKGLWGNTKEAENLRKALLEYTQYIRKNTHKRMPTDGVATNKLTKGDTSGEISRSEDNTKLEKQTERDRHSDPKSKRRDAQAAFQLGISAISETTEQEVTDARILSEKEVPSIYKNALSDLKRDYGLDAYVYDSKSALDENGFVVDGYIFIRIGVDPYWVYGHEMAHLAKQIVPKIFDSILKAVPKLTKKQVESYLSLIDSESYKQQLRENQDMLIEEMIADQFGNVVAGTNYKTYLSYEQVSIIEKEFKNVIDALKSNVDRLNELPLGEVSLSSVKETAAELRNKFDISQKESALGASAIHAIQSVSVKDTSKGTLFSARSTDKKQNYITLGKAFSEQYMKKGAVSLIGQQINSYEDLAVMAQAYRDPRFETMRYFFVNNSGVIVYHTGVTSRIPGSAAIFVGKTWPEQMGWLGDLDYNARRAGAEGYYVLHNHPSGHPNPSSADVSASKWLRTNFRFPFKGHIVINSNKYAVIPENFTDISDVKIEDLPSPKEDKLLQPSKPHPLLGQRIDSSTKFAQIAQSMKMPEDYSTLIFMTPKLEVRGIEMVANDYIKKRGLFKKHIEKASIGFGSNYVALVTEEQDIFHSNLDLISDSYLFETVLSGRRNTGRDMVNYDKDKWMGANMNDRSAEVWEEKDQYGTNKAKPAIIEGDMVRIVDFDAITKAQYSKINTFMKRKGYDWRGPDDARRLLERMGDRKGENIYSGDQADAIKYGLGLDITPEQKAEKEFLSKAVKEFGTTNDVREAGYILTDGRMLDFSEKRDGGPAGSRSLDHRAIERIYDDLSRFDALADFVDRGNIRIHPESGGIYIAKALSEKQISALSRFINYHKGEIYLDLVKDNNHNSTPYYAEYRKGTSSSRILNDIDAYFESGTVPKGNPDPVRFSGRKDIEPVFYRGTVPGETRRIDEPFEAAKGKTFVARKEKSAKAYGSQIERVKAKPGAKILYEETPEFGKVTQRYRWDKDLPLMNQLRKNETIIDAVNDAIIKAEKAGYDAISFSSDSDIGTVILNEDAFIRNADIRYSGSRDISSNEVFYANGVEVIKNPTTKQWRQMHDEFKKEYPQLAKEGEPSIRQTFDIAGNLYIWKSTDGMHSSVEPYIDKKFNTLTHQNKYFDLKYSEDEINSARKVSLSTRKEKESVLYEGQPLFSARKDVRESGWTENKPITGTESRKTSNKSKDSSGVQARTSSAKSSVASTVTSSSFATVTKPVSRTELVDFISEYLDIPIKQGKFRERALGIFKEHPEIIRLKDGKDLDTLFHEMGHYFDKRLGLMDEKYLGELYALGIPASKESYNEEKVMGEGIAEFVRIFTVDPAEAKALAPEFYKDFMKKIALSPGMKDFFDTVKTATINYINQDFENRILGNISVGPNKKKAAFLSRDTLDRIYTAAFDNLHPLKRAVDIITGGEKIDAKDNPFIRAWLYRGVSGKVEAILKYGPIDKNGNKIGKSFEEILSKVDKKSLNDFRAYIVSKHAKELMDEGIATGLSEADVNLTIKKYDNQFEPILKELVEFQRNVLKQLVDAGILSADSYNKITKYEYYVPFNRVMDDTKTSGTGKGLEARNPVYGIKGSGRDIIDPLESIIKNTFIYTNMADRNMIGKAFVDLARKYEGSGKIIDKVPPRMIPQTVMLKELEKVLSSAGADTTEINLDQIATVFRPRGYTNKDNVITVFENGKPTYYEVIDEDLYNAFKSLDQEQTPFYVKILSIPAQVLRAGATGLNVDFIGRNIVRDTIFAGISSKYWFIPFVDSIKGLAHILKKDEVFQSWLYSGGGDSELVSTDRSRIQRYQRNLLQQSGELNVLNIVRHPIDFIRLLGEYSEQATRVGVHGKALKKEGDSVSGRMLAGLASRETTVDFARMGTNVGNINKAIAFFNSALQGGDVLVRAAMRDKGKFALRAIMYITLPSILTYLLNRDDDEYEEIPQYQKDTFWLFKIGGQWWRIPKPFEMGMMFGSLVERFLAYTDKEDPHALDGWAEQLKDTALPDIIPTALLPLIEVWTNHDMFRNMPIIPQGDEYKKPADQYGPYTSSLAKTLGKVFNYSPYKIDHLIKGYGAGVGQNISNIASKGLELTGIAEKKTEPDKPLSQELPIIRGLTVDPQRSSKSVSDFYDRLNELEDDYKQMRDSDGIELNQYPKRKELRAMRKAQIELRDLRKEYNEIYADNKIDAKTKRDKLSKINLEMINVARKAIGKPKIRE